MLHKRDTWGTRKVSPPQPVCMNSDQKASYLADLRSNRPSRPTGSRPLPSRPLPTQDENLSPRNTSALSFQSPTEQSLEDGTKSREQKLAHRASMPISSSFGSLNSQKGRPLVPSPGYSTPIPRRRVSPTSVASPNTEYRESVSRVQEREEAHTIRETLEELDRHNDEERIHNAAKMEAADLVWRHKNPLLAEVEKVAAYPNPDLNKSKYGELARDSRGSIRGNKTEPKPESRSASGESTVSNDSKRPRLPWLKKRTKTEPVLPQAKRDEISVPEHENILQKATRRISGNRHVSSGSSKGVFRNPEDEIYEEAEDMTTTAEPPVPTYLPLRTRESNALRGARPLPEKSLTTPIPEKKIDRFEIWKNPPTQTRTAGYTTVRALPQTPVQEKEPEYNDSPRTRAMEIRSNDIRAATSMRKSDRSPKLPTPTAVSDRPGRPIVSFDPKWRAGQESPRGSQDLERPQARTDGSLSYPVKPTPPVPEITIMEDPGSVARRQAAEERLHPNERTQSAPTIVIPSIVIPSEDTQRPAQSSRPLPRINLPDQGLPTPAVPSISISTDEPRQPAQPSQALPQINLPDDEPPTPEIPSISVGAAQPKSRPLPSINAPSRPLPSHTQSSPSKLPPRPTQSEMASRVPWLSKTPSSCSNSSVTCTACTLPISGRIVTASGSATRTQKARFHPECFTCHYCSTGLECVSFYPEPEDARRDRINAFVPHLDPTDPQVQKLVQSNEDLQFFCHLDYHELFSPRCHNCKTPIEGSIVMALGRHYHADHFFCAECGDPFTSDSPFVEHNSYPYCVSCHTKRTSARCRSCKQVILNEMTVEALGGKWHEACFVCCECNGDFGDEGRFFVREIEVVLTDKEKRRGVGRRVEEVAACQGCEERRVKNMNIFV